jgi:hypothetical protein
MTKEVEQFSKLSSKAKADRIQSLKDVRSHLANQHAHWSEKLIRNLILADTGGIVVVGSLMSSDERYLSSVSLRCSLTFFVGGVLLSLLSLLHEFSGTDKRLREWDANVAKHKAGEMTWSELRGANASHDRMTWRDKTIGWLPGILFYAGCQTALIFLWSY